VRAVPGCRQGPPPSVLLGPLTFTRQQGPRCTFLRDDDGHGHLPERTRRSAPVLDELLDATRDGGSRVLVLRGQPGVGKTALLDYAIDSAQEFRVARSAGIESEMELAFAGVHQLCAPLLDRLDRLPDPQREALRGAVELGGSETTRLLVALATLGLLSDAAEEQRRERRRPDLREVLAREDLAGAPWHQVVEHAGELRAGLGRSAKTVSRFARCRPSRARLRR
jgi:AAA ATPase domain